MSKRERRIAVAGWTEEMETAKAKGDQARVELLERIWTANKGWGRKAPAVVPSSGSVRGAIKALCAICVRYTFCGHHPALNFGDLHNRGEMLCARCSARRSAPSPPGAYTTVAAS